MHNFFTRPELPLDFEFEASWSSEGKPNGKKCTIADLGKIA